MPPAKTLLYKRQTIIQASDYYTSIRLVYKHQTIMQASECYASIRMVCKHLTVIQASDCYRSIRLLCKHQTIKKASDYKTRIILLDNYQTSMHASDFEIIISYYQIIISLSDQHIFLFRSLRLTWGDMYANQVPQNHKTKWPERDPGGSVWAQTRSKWRPGPQDHFPNPPGPKNLIKK